MATLIILEDEPKLASFITRGLSAEGYDCHHAATIESMQHLLTTLEADLAIVDRMIGTDDSLFSLAGWRKKHPHMVFLMLTALGDTEDRIAGLRQGADDYLGKPFDFDELLARIEALLRRQTNQPESDLLTAGPISMDALRQRVWLNGDDVELTTLEYALLQFFVEQPDVVLSRERIINRVWRSQNDPLTNVVDVYINRLRKKLHNAADAVAIETVRGRGYRLVIA